MSIYFFATFVSFIFNFALIVPFINFLYKKKFQRAIQKTRDAFNNPTPVFDRFHKAKAGTPVGGGILIVLSTVFLFTFFMILFAFSNNTLVSNYTSILSEIKIIIFAFVGFAFLGAYDDLNKIFRWQKEQFFGLRLRHKLIFELVLAFIIAFWLNTELKINFIHIPFLGDYNISFFYILFAAFVIVAFANAVNVTDGLDGLASGVLIFALSSFWIISRSPSLDVPMSFFIAIWFGAIIAFLYFNIHPARLFLGDAGSLSFGATFAVIGLLLGKAFSLPIIGGIFVIEIGSSLIQLLGKKYLKRKIFPVAPLHLYLQLKKWEEPKIVMRFWVISLMFAVVGLMISFL